jgi:Tfp pilus assembly protein PilF
MKLLIAVLILFTINFNAYSQTVEDNTDRQLFAELKKRLEKSDAEIYQAMGMTYFQEDNCLKAELFLKKAVSLEPQFFQCWYLLGILNIDSEAGYNYFKKATEADPTFAEPLYWMAYYKCSKRNDNEAVSLFKRYVKVAGNNPKEAERVKAAKNVIDDLLTNKEGKDLSIMRGTCN